MCVCVCVSVVHVRVRVRLRGACVLAWCVCVCMCVCVCARVLRAGGCVAAQVQRGAGRGGRRVAHLLGEGLVHRGGLHGQVSGAVDAGGGVLAGWLVGRFVDLQSARAGKDRAKQRNRQRQR
jgi:hypothetical protein